MIMKRFGLLFYLKKPRGNNSGDRPIYLRITVDGTVTELSIQRSCDPASRNTKAYRATGKTTAARALNTYLDTLQAKVYEAKLSHPNENAKYPDYEFGRTATVTVVITSKSD